MPLSSELISQFVKSTRDATQKQSETTVQGTTVMYNGKMYVRLDGSELLTPVSTTADTVPDERVNVMIKNHTATITGNMSSPAARTDDLIEVDGKVEEAAKEITEFQIIMAAKVNTTDLEAINATIESLKANLANFDNMEAINADILNLQAKYADLEYVDAETISALNADIDDLTARIAEIGDLSVEELEVINADIDKLKAYNAEFTYVSADVLEAIKAQIKELDVKKLSAIEADLKYANIDFSNIGEAAVEALFSKSGIIGDLVVDEGKITGTLVGVTIKGDLIEGGTVVADKLVIKGDDGLFYKLNTDGVTTTTEQTEYNSLSGSVITAKSITAEKVAVDDLVAFDATIGGFNITEDSLYSGVKESVNNTTRGVYLDDTGQVAFGDQSNFLKYFKDDDGNWKLEISARSIRFGTSNKNVEEVFNETITSSVEQFYLSDSPITLTGGSWTTEQPTWEEGKYIWRRTAVTHGDGSSEYTPSANGVCITGNTGAQGESGKGVESSVVTYQAGTSQTVAPTGTWLSSVPTLTTTLPYLWTRTVITYTDTSTSTSYSVSSTLESFEVGGRNLYIIKNSSEGYLVADSETLGPMNEIRQEHTSEFISVEPGDSYVFQVWVTIESSDTDDPNLWMAYDFFDDEQTPMGDRPAKQINNPSSDGKSYGSYFITIPTGVSYLRVSARFYNDGQVKLEKGNKATDWAPAPEDIDNDISDAKNELSDSIASVESNAAALIEQLEAQISMLITDGSGGSLMTQTEDGWTFNMSSITSNLETIKNEMTNMSDEHASNSSAIDKLTSLVNDVANKTAYITMSTDDDGDPCIELGKTDSKFKVRITNSSIDFLEGSSTIAYVNNNTFYATKLIAKNGVQVGAGPGFEWVIRESGNMGLVYITG